MYLHAVLKVRLLLDPAEMLWEAVDFRMGHRVTPNCSGGRGLN
jgi:hypothetical protein